MMTKPFTVVAGKYESIGYHTEESCKYADNFETLDQALSALDEVKDYSWSRIEYNGWKIEAYKE